MPRCTVPSELASLKIQKVLKTENAFRVTPLRIGELLIDPPLVLAPMAGVTDRPFRRLAARLGAGLVTTEMISSEGLIRNHSGSWNLFKPDPEIGVPVAVQIFGSDPETMARVARKVAERGADSVDINAGCPVRKVVRQGAGAALLRTPGKLFAMVSAVKRAVDIPVTVKIRIGWDRRAVNVVEVVRGLEAAGADAVTVHARTAKQLYGGEADWRQIRRATQAVSIPIIGNGDVTGPSDADRMLSETGCDAVMIGRAALGNPWIFSAIARHWGRVGPWNPEPTWKDFRETVQAHLQAFRAERPLPPGHYRKVLMWYSRGLPESSPLRARLMAVRTIDAMEAVFRDWIDALASGDIPFHVCKVGEESARCR